MSKVEITNEEKNLYTNPEINKKEIINYYEFIAPKMLSHLKNRPLVMERYPNGIGGKKFFQKNMPDYFPEWFERVTIKHTKDVTYPVCNNKESLIYLANQACLQIHTWPSKTKDLRYPDKMIFDLDPSDDNSLHIIKDTAKGFRFILERIGFTPYLLSTGSRGLHIVVPLDGKDNFDDVKDLSSQIASFIASKDPINLTIEHRKEKRKGRVFIDIYRNSFSQTSICPYSLRAIEKAPVATPISWEELDTFNPQKWNIFNIRERIKKTKDPWENYFNENFSAKKASIAFSNIFKR